MAKHVVEAEELQAYLDRELEPVRQAEVERHLAGCRECAALLADLQRVSATLQRWLVEPAPVTLRPPALKTAAPERRWHWGRLALALAGSAAVVLLALSVSLPNLMKSPTNRQLEAEKATGLNAPTQQEHAARLGERKEQLPPPPAATARGRESAPLSEKKRARPQGAPRPGEGAGPSEVGGMLGAVPAAREANDAQLARSADAVSSAAPSALGGMAKKAEAAKAPRMIAYEVFLTVEVKEFEPAKQKLLKVVEQAGGYVAQASAAETPNQPRHADLVVRVPAEKLSAVLEQLRGLGRVVNEQLSTQEVTEQVVDLEGRLRNARATEQRLITVLNQRTGKVRDILEVEREIARTREEIERMEAQRQMLLHRVELATVEVTLVEEFQAQLQPAPVGTRTRLANAFVEGYESFVDTLLGFVFFFARYGLTLLFWGGLAWLTWRGMKRPLLKWRSRSFGAGVN